MNRALAAIAVSGLALSAACPHAGDHAAANEHVTGKRDGAVAGAVGSDAVAVDLPVAPPVPSVPLGLPAVELPAFVTPGAVALGAALFVEPRLSTTGKLACASCHDPARDYSGGSPNVTAAGKPNLRRTPSLANLAWKRELGWDGRYGSLDDFLSAHVPGQLGMPLEAALQALADDPQLQAQLARATEAPKQAALHGLEAFVLTRFEGDSVWDRAERSGDPPPALAAGYKLFLGKARCGGCHPPPLYTDSAYHRVTHNINLADKGRGFVDPTQTNAFATPTLRGAVLRTAYFHTGVTGGEPTLEGVVQSYVAASSTVDKRPGDWDAMLDKPIVLSTAELDQLLAFVRSLSAQASPR